ncbi:hypothetical protein [Streptomyces sp. H27-S2]|uniref:hypothetical protein n=1 Tax=Streptomyces antarcticus TaxID=2996458 RepID=UPI0022715098|nr:hypothetical protein [Streptomyces sp. H27-S2]MCY0953065.1 hypothetical protein [Streptomyces sp. H27-S2]
MSAANEPAVPIPPPRPAKRRRPLPAAPATPPRSRSDRGQNLDLPAGYGAHLYPLATSSGFIGHSYSMDSLAFMLWAVRRYGDAEDRFVLAVLVAMIGLQEVGGHIEQTQEQIGQTIGSGYSRSHVAWALGVLLDDGVLRRVRRGVYQIVPSAALRGGVRPSAEGKRKVPGSMPERVHQLDLLKDILEDPKAPDAFKAMAQVDAKLPEGPRQTRKGK